MKIISTMMLIVVLSGCNEQQKAKEIWQNTTREVKILNAKYCSEQNEHWRNVFIAAIRSQLPVYPDGGICKVEQIVNDLLETA